MPFIVIESNRYGTDIWGAAETKDAALADAKATFEQVTGEFFPAMVSDRMSENEISVHPCSQELFDAGTEIDFDPCRLTWKWNDDGTTMILDNGEVS